MVKLATKSGPAKSRKIIRLAFISILANFLLAAIKLLSGIFFSSTVMLADAVNTASDIAVIVLLLAGAAQTEKRLISKEAHGKERSNSVISVILAAILFFVGIYIAYRAVKGIISGVNGTLDAPGIPALIAAFVSVAVKELLYRLSKRAAIKTRSNAMQANAWDHRRDALTSAGGFFAILGARLGFPILDPIAGAVVCLLIFKVAVDIFLDALGKLKTDGFGEETAGEIRQLLLSNKKVLGLKDAKTRIYRDKLYVDIDIFSQEEDSEETARGTAEAVYALISETYPHIGQFVVHVNPAAN